jgi:hypothetical protein
MSLFLEAVRECKFEQVSQKLLPWLELDVGVHETDTALVFVRTLQKRSNSLLT